MSRTKFSSAKTLKVLRTSTLCEKSEKDPENVTRATRAPYCTYIG
jgi:hypothetical protein